MTVRQEKDIRGLLFIWADIDEAYRVTYQRWHNCEHIPDRLKIPGFYAARRYQGLGKAPDFLMLYETYDSKVMASEPYLHAKNDPTPWTKEAISHFSNNGRSILSLVANAGNKPAIDAPYLFVIRFNPPSASRQEFIAWYSEKQLPKISNLDGVYRGRLYEVDIEVSDIPTAEQKISGSKAGQQMFLALFEIASPDLPSSKPWKEAYDAAEFTKGKITKLEDLQEQVYWLDFTMYAPQE